MKLKNNLITALDIGSSKICALIAEVNKETENAKIKGFSSVPSKGIKRGIIVNIEQATKSIVKTVNAVETMSERTVSSCYVSITGDHIRSLNTKGVIPVSHNSRAGIGEAREIQREDIDQVLEHTKAVPLPIDRQILHVIPQEFIVDDQVGIKNPINLISRRLEAKVHLTTYSTTAASNLIRCVKDAGLEIQELVFQPLASSYSALEEDEKELGVILLDIGSGTVDVIVFYEGGVHHTGVINIGGFSVTNDIAYMLRIPIDKAEMVKREYGYAKVSIADKGATFKIDSMGGRPPREISLDTLASYIEPRLEEIFREAYIEAKKSDIPIDNTLGVVLTGGGSLLRGSEELVETIFSLPARIGYPKGFEGLTDEINSPAFTTLTGLIQFAIKDKENTLPLGRSIRGPFGKAWSWLKNISENVM